MKTKPDAIALGAASVVGSDALHLARSQTQQQEIQPYGTVLRYPIALGEKIRLESVALLNQILVDSMTLRDLYKKHQWQVSGTTCHQLHVLYDKHHHEQGSLIDAIGARVQLLGGISIAMAADVAEMTVVPRPPRGREQVPVQLSRLLAAHEVVILQARRGAKQVDELGDDGTHDLLVSDVLRANERQVWFLVEHLVSAQGLDSKHHGAT